MNSTKDCAGNSTNETGGDATRWTYVCRIADILPNTGVCALVGTQQVAVFRLIDPRSGEQQVYALANIDPGSGAAVLARGILGDIAGEPVVASPLYKQHYSLRSGRCLEDDALAVDIFPVRIANDYVLVRRSPLLVEERAPQTATVATSLAATPGSACTMYTAMQH